MLLRMTIHLLCASLAIVICVPTVFACLNPIGQYYISEHFTLDGLSGGEIVKSLNGHKDRTYWQDVLKQLLDRKRDHPLGYSANNHAVALAHLGDVKEAIAILEELEREQPGKYATAANLGTVYELNGENQKALEWIKEGFKRNKDGHSGSEWLHVKILEAKLRLKEDPAWFTRNNTVLNIGFDRQKDTADLYTLDHLGERRSLNDIESALVYQLHERLEFIKPPEPVVADLLADLSSIFAISRTAEDSKAVYDLATTYGTIRPIFVMPPVSDTRPSIASEHPAPKSWSGASIAIIVGSVLALLITIVIASRLFTRVN